MIEGILFIACSVVLGMTTIMAVRFYRASRLFLPRQAAPVLSDTSLPSVTVCIPARNEMYSLTECLERVIASSYEKMEIIVLDDASKDKTSTLIKSFAHSGVRFIESAKLPKGWLGKNHSLERLLKEASGTYILYLDVDTRIEVDTMTQLVQRAVSENAAMVSVLPRREDGWRASVVWSPLRYYWELLFHTKQKPAVASSAWLIHRETLQKEFNGFEQVKQYVKPESFFARALAATSRYRFYIGTPALGVAYEKKWRSQLATSTRLLFPLLGNSIPVSIFAALDLLLFVVPILTLAGGFVFGWGAIHIVAGIAVLASTILYSVYTRLVWRRGWLLGALLWPFVAVQEAILVVVSMIRYKTNSVTWKGRPIEATDDVSITTSSVVQN